MLALGFISPLFFYCGLLLAGAPILIHILNRRRFKLEKWAAMDFLLRAMRKNRRRLRFEQMLLLVTRCLVVLLLGIALARPLGCNSDSLADLASRRSGLHVLVIDNSYPMAYRADRPNAATNLDQAKLIAKAVIDRLSSGGESVAIVTAAQPAQAVIATPAYDLKSAQAAVDRIEQSYGACDEAGALALARDIARGAADQPNKSLYLIDGSTRVAWQTNADAIGSTAKELADLYKAGIAHFNVSAPGEWNDAIVSLTPAEELVTDRFPADFVADVRGYGPGAGAAQVIFKIDDQATGAGSSGVKAAPESSPITYTAPSLAGGLHVIEADVSQDDPLNVDDARRYVVNVVSQLKVLIVEGERGVGGLGSSGAFLDTALNPGGNTETVNGAKSSSYVATERISDLELSSKILGDYRCICLCGVGEIQESTAADLEKFVRQGGTLMVFMGDPVTAENYNATLYKHHLLPGPLTKRIVTAGDQPPHRFAFDPHGLLNPILADFRDQENTGMETAEIYQYWQIDLPPNSKAQRVLDFLPAADAKNQPPDPAITVHSLGAGRVLFYATSADPNSEWTTFMAHQAYPALMHMLILGTVSAGDDWMNLIVGQPLVVPPYVKVTAAPRLTDRNGIDVPIQQSIDADGQTVYRSSPMARPGIYSLFTGLETDKIAVNLPPEPADVRTLDDAALKKILGDVDVRMLGDSIPVEVSQSEPDKDLGWGVMAMVLALAAGECFMAMKFGHYRRT
jgi:aerotolerance regulator-like protein/VWA domain-containing protein